MTWVITLFSPRVGLCEGNTSGCEEQVSAGSNVHAELNRQPLELIRHAVNEVCCDGIGSSGHRYPSCTRQSSCLMKKMVMGMQGKCHIHNKCNNVAFSTPRSHFRDSNIFTTPLVFYFIRFLVSSCGNVSQSMRSYSTNFMVGTRPRCMPPNTMPSGRSGVWSQLFISSRSFGTLVFHFQGGTYL